MSNTEACGKAVYDRVLDDMLGSINDDTGGGWKVLILDHFTTRVLSSALKMSDILERNVSVVEDVSKVREPMPLAGVYFITPTAASVAQLVEDFSGAAPLYPSAHVFFSSKLSSSALSKIKACPGLLKVVKTLKESNLEFLLVDSHTLITDHPNSPELLLGDQADVLVREVEKELDSIALRFTTALATLNEFPIVRYRKGKALEVGDPPGGITRSQLTQRLASKVLERADAMKALGQLPAKETCDLLILDRSYDPVAPFIHEWTYECLVYDLLNMTDGNVYRYNTELQSGKTDEKDASLEETDALWTELRHVFIAEVYSTLGNRFKEFQAKNKAAKLGADGLKGNMTSGSMRQLITALPQFREVLSKLSLHIQISEDLRKVTNERILTDVGELEQDVVLGEKNSKDMLAFLQENQHLMSAADKVRLLMCYCATHPEKLDTSKVQAWAKTAKLSPHDMLALTNLALLGVTVMKSETQGSGKTFFRSSRKEPDLIRAKKPEDGGYALNRFEPLLRGILVDLAVGKLPTDQFPYARLPISGEGGDTGSAASARTHNGQSGRGGLTWTKRGAGGAGSGLAARRLVVLIVGGALRSEMRVCHELSWVLQREVVLASTSVETPTSYLQHLYRMNSSGVIYGT